MSDYPYLLNGQPVTFRELIKEATAWDEEFKLITIKTTSMAAKILRLNGFAVENNPDYGDPK